MIRLLLLGISLFALTPVLFGQLVNATKRERYEGYTKGDTDIIIDWDYLEASYKIADRPKVKALVSRIGLTASFHPTGKLGNTYYTEFSKWKKQYPLYLQPDEDWFMLPHPNGDNFEKLGQPFKILRAIRIIRDSPLIINFRLVEEGRGAGPAPQAEYFFEFNTNPAIFPNLDDPPSARLEAVLKKNAASFFSKYGNPDLLLTPKAPGLFIFRE